MKRKTEDPPVMVHRTGRGADETYPPFVPHPKTGKLIPFDEAADLPTGVRERVYYEVEYPDGARSPRRPFYQEGFNFFDKPLGPVMGRGELVSLGLDDDKLEAMRERRFGPLVPGELPLSNATPESAELQARRYAVFEQVMAEVYRGAN